MPTVPELDLIALAWFGVSILVFDVLVIRARSSGRSISSAIQFQRVAWMRNMADRDNRLVDTSVLQTLSQGNSFFASTCAIAIGGLAAIMGSGEKAQSALERIPLVAKSSGQLWEMKVALLAVIFIFAFFKFAWAYRLSHYTGIVIGSTPIPNSENAEICDRHARSTAALIGVAADHANTGLRSFYYAIAVLAWFVHPLLFIAVSAWVMAILIRREFYSRSLRIICGDAT